VPGTPVIAIGGITAERVRLLETYGVSAIAADPAGATAEFLRVLARTAVRW
jgi:thiamine-phosphate pyrophosphorylase